MGGGGSLLSSPGPLGALSRTGKELLGLEPSRVGLGPGNQERFLQGGFNRPGILRTCRYQSLQLS